MRFTLKKVIRQFLAVCLILGITVTCCGVNVEAAKANKALGISFSFNGKKKVGTDNTYVTTVTGTSKTTKIKGTKLSGEIYIPKKALKKNTTLHVSMGLSLFTSKNKLAGNVSGRYNFVIVNTKGNIGIAGTDNQKNKTITAGSYAKCKAGKGAYKSYYIITLKNIPVMEKVTLGKKTSKLNNGKYKYNIYTSVCSLKTKSSGKMYLDNIKAVCGGKTIANVNFSKAPAYYGVNHKGKALPKSKVKIEKIK